MDSILDYIMTLFFFGMIKVVGVYMCVDVYVMD